MNITYMDIGKLPSKEITKRNKKAWDALDVVSMQLDANLVRCQKYLFPDPKGLGGQKKKLLYIGFGEGQNLTYLVKEGFDVYGTEISKTRLREATRKLKGRGLKASLELVDSSYLPFEDNFFDVIVAWQSLYYNNEQTLKESLIEIKRVLMPGGQFLSSMISPKQKRLCHKKIAASVYRPARQTGQQNCVIFCFKDKAQIRKMYRLFKNIRIGFYGSDLLRGQNFHYVIHCNK